MRNANNFSKSETSKEVALRLLSACSAKAVKKVLDDFPEFEDEKNWVPYGGVEKNWDRVGNQSSSPVGALTELLINSIDAILMRRAREENIDLRGDSTPQSMHEAVKRFFPEVYEGKLALMNPVERTKLAEKSVLVGIKRRKQKDRCPNYTIVDYGEGQNHTAFKGTFLSLGEKNKEGIPFVQGRFNMGSTGSIRFCTRSDILSGHYKFILSKRNLLDDTDDLWGWTIIRIRKARKGEVVPVAEYFCPNCKIAHFTADKIQAFGRDDIGVIRGGSIVKLYEYDITPQAARIDFGLRDALITNLIDCAIPLRIYDFDAKPGDRRPEGISDRTFSGMKSEIKQGNDDGESDIENCIENSENPDLGKIKIHYFGRYKIHDAVEKEEHRIFFTINGQTQAKLRASTFRKMGLEALRNHLIVQVDCDAMDNTARAMVFMPNRERMADSRFARSLREIVIKELQEDKDLKQFAATIRERRVKNQIASEEDEKFLSGLIKNSPELLKLFDIGGTVAEQTTTPGGQDKYDGKKFPTFLHPLNLGDGAKKVPLNGYRRIKCETDAANDYLIRDDNQGEFVGPSADELPHSQKLRNGILRITVYPPRDAKVGDKVRVQFGFRDNNPDRTAPLLFEATIEVSEADKEASQQNPRSKNKGVKKRDRNEYKFPNIEWVSEADWGKHKFNEESGGDVDVEPLTIYVNQDHRYLKNARRAENDESKRESIQHRFKIGVGLLTLALYKRLVEDRENDAENEQDDWRPAFLESSSAIAPLVVALIEKLGGDK